MPDDLVEGSVETLFRIHRDEMDFWDTALSTIEALDGQGNEDGLRDNRLLRILSILCTLFEKSSSRLASSEVVGSFIMYVLPAISHSNALVREAAVNCLGKVGLFTKQDRVLSEFTPMLLERVQDEDEKLSIRAQALLGLSDWSVLFADFFTSSNSDTSIQSTLLKIMNQQEISLACVAAEVTSKLLYHGKFFNESCLGTLLVLFFDSRLTTGDEEDDDNDAKEVGSPIRLQQLLTQFFLLFCLRGEKGRQNFISCTRSALDVVLSKDAGKRKRGTKAFPIAKMIEFLTSTADEAKRIQDEKKEGKDGAMGSSTDLLVAIQIAKFIAGNSEDLNVTTLRMLCKILGSTEVNPEQDETQDLKNLVEHAEDLGNLLTDESCLRHLESLNEVLDGIDFPNESTLLDEEEESLNEAMERVHITPSRAPVDKENSATKGQTTVEKMVSLGSPTVRPSRLSMSSVNEA
jgi:hypothetical protein